MWGYLEALRSFGKQNAVGFSLFHNWAISEQSQAIAIGTKGIKGKPDAISGTFAFNPDYWRGIKSGVWEIVKKPDRAGSPPVLGIKHQVALDWVQHGLRLGTADAEGAVVKAMQESTFNNPVLNRTAGTALRAAGRIHYVLNRGLWDYYLPGQMMHAADMIFGNEMRLRPRSNPEEIASLKHEITQHVNKVFGTESLEALMIHPKMRYALNFALFAPVWTFSNFRVLTNGFQNETAKKLTGRWALGAAMTWFATSNLANLAMTGWTFSGKDGPMPDKDGVRRPHFMWDNDGLPVKLGGRYLPGVMDNAGNIAAGYNADGSVRYIRFGKGFREPIMALIEPNAYFAGKMGLIPKAFVAAWSGHEPGTGFEVVNLATGTSGQIAAQRGMIATELVAPFVAQDALRKAERYLFPELVPEAGISQAYIPHTAMPLGLPAKKGISLLRATNAYEQAKRDHRDDIAELILKQAELNHINRSRVLNSYRDRMNKEKRIVAGPKLRYDEYGNPAPPPVR
jgi:hypothetical protein